MQNFKNYIPNISSSLIIPHRVVSTISFFMKMVKSMKSPFWQCYYIQLEIVWKNIIKRRCSTCNTCHLQSSLFIKSSIEVPLSAFKNITWYQYSIQPRFVIFRPANKLDRDSVHSWSKEHVYWFFVAWSIPWKEFLSLNE